MATKEEIESLFEAAEKGDTERVRALLAAGVSANVTDKHEVMEVRGRMDE